MIVTEDKIIEAFGCIALYDGHEDWLLNLADELEKADKAGKFVQWEFEPWHTEAHCLYMMLVGLFGNWGISIRSGWIEECGKAAAFIRACDLERD